MEVVTYRVLKEFDLVCNQRKYIEGETIEAMLDSEFDSELASPLESEFIECIVTVWED